ncbi:AP-3 complex subunit sigma [Acorus calamus]|uniref:AP-3 complex subunit sigma n=1 Tax=Acorus calamus TaxID=4465 RepID=A0AAV9CHT2_ACOCL|nr:AP-3 complex subunit sigma [Acorus calamus]
MAPKKRIPQTASNRIRRSERLVKEAPSTSVVPYVEEDVVDDPSSQFEEEIEEVTERHSPTVVDSNIEDDILRNRAENVSNFIQADAIFGPIFQPLLIEKVVHASCRILSCSENELAMLDLIQVFVETLDKCFKNVCELDIVYNFNKMHTVLDEIIFGGQVLETSSEEVIKVVEEIAK